MNGVIGALIVAGCVALGAASATAADAYKRVEQVYRGSTTVVGEPIVYPAGIAEVRSIIVTLLPGEATGWHVHGEPLFGYILEGEVTVDYGAQGIRIYRQGTGFMEATAIPHDGRNTGTRPCRILAVFMGAKGLVPTRPVPPPQH